MSEPECVPGSGHPCVVPLNRRPPRPHSDSVRIHLARLRVCGPVPLHVWARIPGLSLGDEGSWVQLSGDPSSLLCVCECLFPFSIPERESLLTSRLFPQVPPGAAETQKAPGASELHGGHLQGTRALREGSGRKGSLGPLLWQGIWPRHRERWAGVWRTHTRLTEVCG